MLRSIEAANGEPEDAVAILQKKITAIKLIFSLKAADLALPEGVEQPNHEFYSQPSPQPERSE